MKANGVIRQSDYTRIKRRLYAYVLAAAIAAITLVAILRQLTRGVFGDWLVNLLERSFYLSTEDALRIYQYAVRNNMHVYIYLAVAVCFFVLCRILLSSFMRYFDEISVGIDSLIRDEGRPIELSAEMAYMEQRLNTLRQTLERREQDARLAEQRKNDLVVYLAHDIKTPLTSVIGYLSLLDEAGDLPSAQRAKYVQIALRKANRLERLVDEFFDITRYSLQTITLAKQSIDLCYMLAQMADEFYLLLEGSGKRITLDVPEEMSVYGDPDKLARVFNNVLRNAAAYSPDNGVIDITARVCGQTAAVVITNTGGIPKDKLALIFDKFYRLDTARSTDTGGAGLGLAIAREIVASHGGRIYADSDGTRTAFTVELPVGHPTAGEMREA